MKTILVSMLSGIVGAAIMLAFFQPSFAEQVNERANQMLDSGACQVSVGFGHMTYGPTCYHGEVMVGQNGDYIYCSDITVTCPN